MFSGSRVCLDLIIKLLSFQVKLAKALMLSAGTGPKMRKEGSFQASFVNSSSAPVSAKMTFTRAWVDAMNVVQHAA